jgi:O-antigen/teichoic acid export membrane protein
MRRLASDSVIYGLGSVANQALSFLLLPLYTQYLTPADYGTLALLGAAGGVLALIVNAGVQSGLTRIFFDYENEDDRAAVVFTALAFTVVTTIAFTVPLYLGADALTPLLFDRPDRGQRCR